MPSERYEVELTSQASKDMTELRSYLLRVAAELLELRDHPRKGHPLAGTLRGVRSLEFSLPGGAYRAAYVVDDQRKLCSVFAVGPHENFYKLVERRYAGLRW